MEAYQTHRPGNNGVGQLLAEKFQAHVHRTFFCQGVHVDADLFPFIVVADSCVPNAFGPGARHFAAAGPAVADQAAFTYFAQPGAGRFHQLFVIHDASSLICVSVKFPASSRPGH